MITKLLQEDEHDRVLLENLHPASWRNPEPEPRYDLVILGAGIAGLVGAVAVAGRGGKVAIVENDLMGGDCLTTGCVPSKAILRSSRFFADLRDAGLFGAPGNDSATVDTKLVLERVRRIRARLSRADSVERFRDLGAHVFLGTARFSGRDSVEVGGKTLHFRKALIATGAHAIAPEIPGLAEVGYLTNETVFNLIEAPRRLLVLGGGPLGCELAQAFHRLGSAVVIVQKEPLFLPREERDAAQILAEAFEQDGMTLRLNTDVQGVSQTADGKVVRLIREDVEDTIAVDEILVGAGRAPTVEGLNLEGAGVRYDRENGVIVDDHLQTTNSRIYAAGDVCLATKFAHMADATARIAVQNALFLGRRRLSALTIPWCTYTDPEIAHVGLYVREALERKIPVKTFTVPFSDVDRAVTDGEEIGFVKITVREGTDRILGATVVGRQAGEILSELTLAIVERIGLCRLADVIHPYPTRAEAIHKAAEACHRARLTPRLKALSSRWLAWAR